MARADLVTVTLESEEAFRAHAAAVAKRWAGLGLPHLLVGLQGELGAGKTTWVRGLLTGLGYSGRVPSPTYTLLEHYELPGLTVVHLDLYRLGGPESGADSSGELDALGVRDWLARERVWIFAEWPERAPLLHAQCHVRMRFEYHGATQRRVTLSARGGVGRACLSGLEPDSERDSS